MKNRALMYTKLLSSFNYNKSIQNELALINQPLADNLSISFLGYRRFYPNGKLFCFFNDDRWIDYSFNTERWKSLNFQNRIKNGLSLNKPLYFIWPRQPDPSDPVYCALYEFNLWNGIIIIRAFEDCIESFAFCGKNKEIDVTDLYLNHTDLLERYILYFKDKAHPLLHPKTQELLIDCPIEWPVTTVESAQMLKFKEETPIDKYPLRHKGETIRITKQEINSVALLSHGKKIKEIANSLNLSPRTVEYYLANVKRKLGGPTNSRLIDIYKQNFP